MKNERRETQMDQEEPETASVGPYDRQGPIKVSFGVYFISLILVALVIFILMLVQYFPGYRSYHRIADAVKNANNVYMGIRIPKEKLKNRKINPLTKEDDIAKILRDMGAKSASCDINTQGQDSARALMLRKQLRDRKSVL